LQVLDANDNIPAFSAGSFSFDVYESAAKGIQVLVIALMHFEQMIEP
jgi:hypothetical protein